MNLVRSDEEALLLTYISVGGCEAKRALLQAGGLVRHESPNPALLHLDVEHHQLLVERPAVGHSGEANFRICDRCTAVNLDEDALPLDRCVLLRRGA